MKNIVLFGAESKIVETLNSDAFASKQVYGLCINSAFGVTSIEGYKIVRWDELDQIEDLVVVCVDQAVGTLEKETFASRGITLVTVEEFAAMEEEPVVEEAPVEEVSESVAEEETAEPQEETATEAAVETKVVLSEEQYQDLKLTIKQYYESVVKYVGNVKTKDDAIYNINKELQAFKNDFYYQLLKPFVSDIIELRESCKKTLADVDTYNFGKDECLKNGSFTLEEIENLLMIHEVEVKEGIYYYGNREIFPNHTPVEYFGMEDLGIAIDAGVVEETNEEYEQSIAGIQKQLEQYQKNIEIVYGKNEKLAQAISEQRKIIKQQQETCNGKLVIPLLLKIININEYCAKQFMSLKLIMDEIEAVAAFKRVLEHVVSMLSGLLQGYGILVKDNLDDALDMKYHKVIKMIKISAEEAEKDKKIERFCTDCYLYNDKVIYPAKVNIYKL